MLGLLTELGLWQGGMMQGMPQTIRNTCCRRAYVRGLFLCCGSVTNPEKAYHLEWNCKEEALCQALYKQLVAWQIPAHTIRRKNSFVVYIKDGEHQQDHDGGGQTAGLHSFSGERKPV